MLIRLGSQNFDASRYRDMRRFGEKLVVCFAEPAQAVTITGYDDVAAAIEEVRSALAELERDRMGTGWVTFGGEDDGD